MAPLVLMMSPEGEKATLGDDHDTAGVMLFTLVGMTDEQDPEVPARARRRRQYSAKFRSTWMGKLSALRDEVAADSAPDPDREQNR